MVLTLWKFRRFILVNALADLRHRFSGSVGGYLWNVIIPLLQITVFALVFSVLMEYQMEERPDLPKKYSFIIFLCSGLLPWSAFAETLVRSAGGLVGNAGYLKKLPLPEQIFVAEEACGGFITGLVSLTLFVIFSVFIAGYGPYWEWLQMVPLLALFLGFAYGLGLILACLNVFFRDIATFLNVIMFLWMYMTPVVYLEKMFEESKHTWMLTFFQYNPPYHYIKGFHEALYYHQWLLMERWLTCLGITVGFILFGALIHRQLRSAIRDVL
jgi:lipopolysaccharide transport system permease protein